MTRTTRWPPPRKASRGAGSAVRVGAQGAGEGAERARADRAVLLVTAESVAVAHVPELPHACPADPGLGPVRVEVPRSRRRKHAVLTRLRVAAGDELGRAVVGHELDLRIALAEPGERL